MPTFALYLAVFTLLVGLVSGWAISKALAYLRQTENRLSALEQTVQDLQKAQAKHLPYKTADEIEHATAALMKLKFESDFRADIIENALNHLQIARNGNGSKK